MALRFPDARTCRIAIIAAVLTAAFVAAGCPPPAQCEKKDNMVDNNAWALVAPEAGWADRVRAG
jgi:hypothetical protein